MAATERRSVGANLALYTLARVVLFLLAWGLVWVVASRWLQWNRLTGLWTALLALVVSALASYLLLGSLRDRIGVGVQDRARRARAKFEQSRRREDLDE